MITELDLSGVSFVDGNQREDLRASAVTRYRGAEAKGTLERISDWWRFAFDEPQGGAAPGQAAVFYEGEEVLGGGTIEQVR
jgi:tRNA-specific 2-thiouridylase